MTRSDDRYTCYRELRNHEEEGKDYRITIRCGSSGIAVLAPHGGGIEPGTSELADAVAGTEHAFYSFTGLKPKGNGVLHITSTRFDEPLAVTLLQGSRKVLTIHGCVGEEEAVFIGGRDHRLKERIRSALCKANFAVKEHSSLKGDHHCNLCNRNAERMGVQLEVSAGLRRSMFRSLHTGRGRKDVTEVFRSFVCALRSAL